MITAPPIPIANPKIKAKLLFSFGYPPPSVIKVSALFTTVKLADNTGNKPIVLPSANTSLTEETIRSAVYFDGKSTYPLTFVDPL
jgi:hypothetical protein